MGRPVVIGLGTLILILIAFALLFLGASLLSAEIGAAERRSSAFPCCGGA